jgi:RsmE family RNA methyltransferase
VLLAVGPEGGWNEFELGLLQTHRFQPVAMGERTLRSDTAVIAMLALVHDARRDAHPKASAQHDARLPRYDGR